MLTHLISCQNQIMRRKNYERNDGTDRQKEARLGGKQKTKQEKYCENVNENILYFVWKAA